MAENKNTTVRRSMTKTFILKLATEEDLDDLEVLLNERKKELNVR